MSKEKLTPWFPGNVKPARAGVYETKLGLFGGYSRWTGKFRTDTEQTKKDANRCSLRGAQAKQWRGLATPPKAKP